MTWIVEATEKEYSFCWKVPLVDKVRILGGTFISKLPLRVYVTCNANAVAEGLAIAFAEKIAEMLNAGGK